MSRTRVGFALTGSFCTFSRVFEQIRRLTELGYDVTAVLSFHAAALDTRFYKASDVKKTLAELTGKPPLTALSQVEPIGPQKLLDAYIIAPMTGASLGKMARGIFDTPALLGAKSQLRNERPVLIAPSTNDGLGICAESIGKILTLRNVYFVPLCQDDPVDKPRSVVARFDLIPEALAAALAGAQIQPVLTLPQAGK